MKRKSSAVRDRFPPGLLYILAMDACVHLFNEIIRFRALQIIFMSMSMEEWWLAHIGSHKLLISPFIFYGGWIADSYLGKYIIFIISMGLNTATYIPLILVATTAPTIHSNIKKTYLVITDLIKPYINFGSELKRPLIAEQFSMPEMLEKLALYLYYEFWLRNLGTFIGLGILPVLKQEFSCNFTYCVDIPNFVGIIINTMYFFSFLKLRRILYLRRRRSLIVEKMFYFTITSIRKKILSLRASVRRKNSVRRQEVMKMGKDFYTVFIIIICCAPYWAFREYVHVSWIRQANIMDNFAYIIYIHPFTVNALPALLNLFMLPIVYKCVYPHQDAWRYTNTPLKSIGIAYCFIGCAFLSASLVNILIERSAPFPLLKMGEGQLKIYNGLSYTIHIHCPWVEQKISIEPYDLRMVFGIPTMDGKAKASTVVYSKTNNYTWIGEIIVHERRSVSYIAKKNGMISVKDFDEIYTLAAARPKVNMYCADECILGTTISLYNVETSINFSTPIPKGNLKTALELYGLGDYILFIGLEKEETIRFGTGEVHSLLFYIDSNGKLKYSQFLLAKRNEINILYMVPQCIFLSLADVFAYVPFNLLLYIVTPADLRGLCYSFSAMLKNIGDGLVLLFQYFHPLRPSIFQSSLTFMLFIFIIMFLFFCIKLKENFKFEE